MALESGASGTRPSGLVGGGACGCGTRDEVVHRKFYLCADLNKAANNVRKAEHDELACSGRQTFKGSNYFWVRNFPVLCLQTAHLNLRIRQAWQLKRTLRGVWQYCYEGSARKFFGDWLAQVTRSGLTPMKKVAAMFVRHLPVCSTTSNISSPMPPPRASTLRPRAISPTPVASPALKTSARGSSSSSANSTSPKLEPNQS